MSITYSAELVVGLRFKDLSHNVAYEDLVDHGDLYRFSPYFDAPNDDCVYGVPVFGSGSYSYSGVSLPSPELSEAFEEFHRLTGQYGQVILTVHAR